MTPENIKVLMISKALVVGAYHKKLEALARLGVSMHLVVPEKWGNRKAEICQSDLYDIHQLPVVFTGRNHFHFYLHLARLIDSIRPHVIHVDEESYSTVTFHAMRLAAARNIPALFFNWQNIFKSFPWPFSSMERYTIANASAGIAGTDEARNVLMRKGCRIPIVVIPQFGVDTAVFSPRPQPKLRERIVGAAESFVVGFAGRFVPEKGIDDLINVCSQLPPTVHLVLIGEGPMEKEFDRRASARGMSSRIHIARSVRSTEMPEYLNILDCLVLPSRTQRNWKEQFGRVLIEAMACEVAVVGSSSGEIPNVIGDAGAVFPEGDCTRLRELLADLMINHSKRMELGQAGRQRVQENYTQQIIADDTLEVYYSVLKQCNENRH
jgi:glycosyltransferase involved in cell wall biosynthesis